MKSKTAKTGVTLLALTHLLGGAAIAQEQTAGEIEFKQACAVCHGLDATGNGPLADQLKVMPPDLTVLKKNNEGAFPFAEVLATVDGRADVRAHGSQMPVWGDRFKADTMADGEMNAEINALGRMSSIVYYLDSIQQ